MKVPFSMNIRKISLTISGFFLVIFAIIFFLAFFTANRAGETEPLQSVADFDLAKEKSEQESIANDIAEEETVLPTYVLLDIPFTPQAPFGNWEDPMQDYGCEEASVLMTMYWVDDTPLTFADAEQAIIAISEFEKENYGEFHDTSLRDTARFLEDYFDYHNISVKSDVTIEDIKLELARGNAVIAPLDGSAIHNPYYTPPGPTRHKLVIRGYDDVTQEFITNDPGTKRGEGLRYDYKILVDAIGDYPTGHNEPISERENVVLVISK